jgi:hypothetical protein
MSQMYNRPSYVIVLAAVTTNLVDLSSLWVAGPRDISIDTLGTGKNEIANQAPGTGPVLQSNLADSCGQRENGNHSRFLAQKSHTLYPSCRLSVKAAMRYKSVRRQHLLSCNPPSGKTQRKEMEKPTIGNDALPGERMFALLPRYCPRRPNLFCVEG